MKHKQYSKRQRYVSASEIGAVTFCVTSFYHNCNGAQSSKLNRSQRMRGNIAHSELSQQAMEEARQHSWWRRLFGWLLSLIGIKK